ncbi:MAG: PKD domain-containing protein [Chlorobi bacterium]|nr:PKD domain-containing protein [Chlorobiota bacterium]
MKRILTSFIITLFTLSVWAQSPSKISYQAVVRNADGDLVTSTGVGLKISLLQGAADGPAVFEEQQDATTNENGLLAVEIGAVNDSTLVDWANGPYFSKVEIDIDDDGTYDITTVSEILSVPYAMYATQSENASALSEEIMELLNKHDIGTVSIISGDAELPQDVNTSLSMEAQTDFTANKYSWDFGDGTTIKDTTAAGVNHTYSKTGCFNVTLTASSDVLSSSVTELDFVQIGDTVIEDAEGNKYATITLGDQTWLGGDLKTLTAADGSAITLATDSASYYSLADTAAVAVWENYDPSTNNLIYNYHAAMIACPEGWHLPSMDEWEALKTYLTENGYTWDGSTDPDKEAKAVASRVGWRTGGSSVEGCVGYDVLTNNATGLSLGPNVVYYDGKFDWLTNRFAWYWTATPYSATNADIIFMYYAYSYIHTGLNKPFKFGYNIRCIKD